jgi:outer membrane lipoprotein SlyB
MSVATAVTAAVVLTACGTADPYGANNYPAGSPPPTSSYPSSPNQPVAYLEYGRITNVEQINTGATANQGTAGTIIGGVAGAVIGNQIGSGGGRAAATVLGALGGAVVGNRVDRGRNPPRPVRSIASRCRPTAAPGAPMTWAAPTCGWVSACGWKTARSTGPDPPGICGAPC